MKRKRKVDWARKLQLRLFAVMQKGIEIATEASRISDDLEQEIFVERYERPRPKARTK
jgi:hypothetical protein